MKGPTASLKQAVALYQAGKIAEAAAMYITLARALVMHKRMEAATGLLVNVLPTLRGDTDFIKAATAIMIDAGHTEKAIAFLRPLTEVSGPVDGGLLIAHAAASHQAGLNEEARRLTRRAVEAVPVHLKAKQPGQVLLVGILNQAPMTITDGTTPAICISPRTRRRASRSSITINIASSPYCRKRNRWRRPSPGCRGHRSFSTIG